MGQGNASDVTRRGFLVGAGAGLAAGSSLAWLGSRWLKEAGEDRSSNRGFNGHSVEVANPTSPMPGPFPGRVIEVHHPGSVRADHTTSARAVKEMMDRGLRELTGADHVAEVWRRFFGPGDVVGIKVNPVGRSYRPDQPSAISSPAVLIEVVEGLKSAGVRPQDVIVFERYADQFRSAGYEAVLRERPLDGVRWFAAAAHYHDLQVDIEGYDGRRDRDPHVVGYDPDVFVHMGYASPEHDPKDDRRFRSHLSLVASRMVNKIVNLPVLKDHGSAGVTLALKNLSHGLNNNVARSHLGLFHRGTEVSGPNQCNTFIPMAVAQPLIRDKVVLHVMDGLVAVYQGGPGCGLNWPYRSLFFATDPVALDHVGWDVIDAKRAEVGMPPVGRMGLHSTMPGGRGSESFDLRQPEHIILAGTVGLGVFDPRGIDHRRIAFKG
jgi:uncharacterized protein (DUF362 family)